ncbi:hypothetical protein [Paenibacillus qinlingensis]|uniref:hypothetical protein n=1 Tax=Paenibacillus qinlingensis TaxID=1837343 RepID=UPI001563BE9F|nr:hypothetical protein [Paenibacillus qinlingensis]NQX61588.1 hypothetical protein [Paenibacillus qinlingensis]
MGWVGLGWVGLGWVGLGWVGLGWVGLGWVGLGWLLTLLQGAPFRLLSLRNQVNWKTYSYFV